VQLALQPFTFEDKHLRFSKNTTESRQYLGRARPIGCGSVQAAVNDLLGDYSQFHIVIASMVAHPSEGIINL